MNKWIGIGRLTSDPTITSSQSGTNIAKYRLAVDRPFKQDGQQTADFIPCIAFGKSADFASRYLQKGMRIAVEGRIQTGSYTKDDGTKVYTTDIIVDRHEFCESKGSGTAADPLEVIGKQAEDLGIGGFVTDAFDDDDDLPFF